MLLLRSGSCPSRWRKVVSAAIVCGPMVLAACTVGPDFAPPAPPSGGYTRESAPAAAIGGGGIAGTGQRFEPGRDIPGEWWKLFHSKTIDALVAEAVAKHPDIAAGQAALRAARETALAAQGSLLPQASFAGNQQRLGVSPAQSGLRGSGSVFDLSGTSVSISYALDVFGGERRKIEGLEAGADLQRLELEATQLSLTANVVNTIISDASLRAQIAATNDIIRSETEQRDLLQRQFQLGAVAQTDVLLQDSNLAQAKAGLPALEKQFAQNRNQLMAYLGRLPSEDRGEHVTLDELKLPGRLPLSLPSALVRQRPDVAAAEATLHQSNAQIGVATANMLPKVNLSASWGSQALSPAELFGAHTAAWSLASSVGQPIFQGGALLHDREAAIARRDEAAARYRSTVIRAFQNVADALRAIQADAKALVAQTEAETAAARSLDIARSQYKAGGTTWTTVLTADQAYQNTRIARVKAQAQRFADTTALMQALGGGWWNRVDETREAEPRPLGEALGGN